MAKFTQIIGFLPISRHFWQIHRKWAILSYFLFTLWILSLRFLSWIFWFALAIALSSLSLYILLNLVKVIANIFLFKISSLYISEALLPVHRHLFINFRWKWCIFFFYLIQFLLFFRFLYFTLEVLGPFLIKLNGLSTPARRIGLFLDDFNLSRRFAFPGFRFNELTVWWVVITEQFIKVFNKHILASFEFLIRFIFQLENIINYISVFYNLDSIRIYLDVAWLRLGDGDVSQRL